MNDAQSVVLSGMRPTGKLHIGHVEGVLTEWTRLQQHTNAYFFVADWHAMTTNTDTSELKRNTLAMVKDWIAAGVDPARATIFAQSAVPEHAELHVALSNLVNLGRLERLPTFHEYMRQIVHADGVDTLAYDAAKRANVSHGFLGYPVLQSADILLYKTTHVPIGEDQVPHLELTRELARRFNSLYGETFPVPEAVLGPNPRILGFDGRKMSKSYGNVIEPTDEPAVLQRNVAQMTTDPAKTRRNDRGDPSVCSAYDLHEIYARDASSIADECRAGARGCVDCKRELAQSMAAWYEPFRERRASITDDDVRDILGNGNTQARVVARETMDEVKHALGIDYLVKTP